MFSYSQHWLVELKARESKRCFHKTIFRTNKFSRLNGCLKLTGCRENFNISIIINLFKNEYFRKSSGENTKDFVASSTPFWENENWKLYNPSNLYRTEAEVIILFPSKNPQWRRPLKACAPYETPRRTMAAWVDDSNENRLITRERFGARGHRRRPGSRRPVPGGNALLYLQPHIIMPTYIRAFSDRQHRATDDRADNPSPKISRESRLLQDRGARCLSRRWRGKKKPGKKKNMKYNIYTVR